MYNIALGIIVFGGFIAFGSDSLYKKGKIKDLKSLLLVKGIGLGITILGLILLIKFY